MNYQEFVGSVTDFLRESLPGGTRFQMIPLEKNNGVIADGLSVRKEGRSVAPTIYLDAYYREYQGGRSLRGICEQILECCEDDAFGDSFDVNFFADYEKVRKTVLYKLVNYEKNRELLAEVPHIHYLDLALVFYCFLEHTPVGNATVLIRDSHIRLWKVGCADLYQAAKENMGRLCPPRICDMGRMLAELTGEEEPDHGEVSMYVLTNARKVQGAACILSEGFLKECARRIGEAFYLLPSSIHEMIAVPVSLVEEPRELAAMVREMNQTQVRSTEVLSDNIYLYSPISGQLTIAEG